MVRGPITVFGLLNGYTVSCEVTLNTHQRLHHVALQYTVNHQDIVNGAFHKYGVTEGALLKYIEEYYPLK